MASTHLSGVSRLWPSVRAAIAGGMALGALLVLAPAADAFVVSGAGGARFGVQPITGATVAPREQSLAPFNGMLDGPIDSGDAVYHGGPVVHGLEIFAIFWDPGSVFQSSTESLIARYLADVAHDSGSTSDVFSVADQYTDANGGASYSQSFGGSFVDTSPFPTSGNCTQSTATASTCLYDGQEASELQSFVASHGLPHGLGALYFIFTPDTTVTCMDGTSQCSNTAFCSYHSYVGSAAQTLLYAAIPFTLLDSARDAKSCQDDGNGVVESPNGDPGFGDVAIKSMSHEEMETITDPLLSAWYFPDGDEVSDSCNGVFWNPDSFLPTEGGSAAAGTLFNQTINGDHYYLQGAWSNETQSCQLMSALEASITAPTSAVAGDPVALSGSVAASAPIASGGYTWQFGDGQTASGSSVTHVYSAPGSYTITLSVTDADGESGSTTSQITVASAGSLTRGRTAGASGSSKPKSTTRCGPVHQLRGAHTRLCTTTYVSYSTRFRCERKAGRHGAKESHSCRKVLIRTTRRQSCRLTNSSEAETVSSRCTPLTVHRSIEARRPRHYKR